MQVVPRWARALLVLDDATSDVAALTSMAAAALVQRLAPPEAERSLATLLYTHEKANAATDAELFPWEEEMLADAAFPRSGRVLVAACGEGRETLALRRRGYRVVGFDPVPEFVTRARARHGNDEGVTLVEGSFADARAIAATPTPTSTSTSTSTPTPTPTPTPTSTPTPTPTPTSTPPPALVHALQHEPIDAILVGWGGLSHVTDESDRRELLLAFRALAPAAPLLVSFVPPVPEEGGPLARLVRSHVPANGASRKLHPGAGLYAPIDESGLRSCAGAAGYEIALVGLEPYGYALLVPRRAPSAAPKPPSPERDLSRSAALAALAITRLDRLTQRARGAFEEARNVAFATFLDEAARDALTDRAYARNDAYVGGGVLFERGLFRWERRLVEHTRFPQRGRVLVTAAGGGREALALVRAGYRVLAFERCAPLLAHLVEVARNEPHLEVVPASYDDLVDAARASSSPLAQALRREPLDAVVLGWGSLPHLPTEHAMRAVLEALRTLAPRASVALSFFVPEEPPPGSARARLARALNATLARIGLSRDPHLAYHARTGFLRALEPSAVPRLAREAGYETAHMEIGAQPWALLVPRARTRVEGRSERSHV